jgi:O-antigen/teichoic acid export membrane protein
VTHDASPSPNPSLRSRAIRASAIRVTVYGLTRILSLVANAVLSHLLAPDIFGLMMLSQIVVQGVAMFSEIGIGAAIISGKRSDAVFINTGWTMQVVRGMSVFLVCATLGLPASLVYNQTDLRWIIPVIAINSLVAGFNSTSLFTLNRSLAEGKRSLLELGTCLLSRTVMIGWALASPSIWAMLIGTLAGTIWYMTASHWLLHGWKNRFRWDKSSVSELTRFGKWIFIGTVIAFLGQQADRMMLGKLETLAVIGVYGIAMTVASLPKEAVGVVMNHVLFPVLAELARGDPAQLSTKFNKARRPVLAIASMGVIAVTAAAPWYFLMLYDARYHDAIWLVPLGSAGVWFSLLDISNGRALLAVGNTRALAFGGACNVAATVAGGLAGHSLGSITGFILGTACGSLSSYVVTQIVMRRMGLNTLWEDCQLTIRTAVAVAALILSQSLWPADRSAWLSGIIPATICVVPLWLTAIETIKVLRQRT